ncbi:predicted protein [Naegleria gruberi]|uniref:Predicted protein n=1 Tax=Naegleria gruberi TaxID=5762 RepID=D2W1G7_NAEGR|nr:uncharacterized protein NAEGRDRAFT_75211 [Naegleria gruberi]EFC37086.1 predicted protein [Naegleria gruberi]|eukprot:XP_002669830.1 predicted protein [Naegleria gruberi strain NEG-M]
MGQSSTTCENDEHHLGMLDDDYEPQTTSKKHRGSTKNSGGRKELTTQTKMSSDEQKPIQAINERIKWPNENLWRDKLVDSAYKVSKNNRSNTKTDQLFTLPTELIASSICQFLDIRSVIYLMRGTNRKIYKDLQDNLTHFFFVPMVIDEDGDGELDDSYFPEDHKKPKQQTQEKPKIIFPPKHAFSWYWEPILATFPKLTIVQIPQLYILNQHFDVRGDLSPLTSLKLINNRCLEHKFLERFPQYGKIIVTNDDKDAFSANPRFIDSYRNVHTLQLSCVKNIDNETMNRFLGHFPNLKSLYISTCQFTNAVYTPPTRKGEFIKDPNCVIDFTGLSSPYLEELTVLCIESMYDVSSLIENSSKLIRFRFSSTSNVLLADKLESLCVSRQNQLSLYN